MIFNINKLKMSDYVQQIIINNPDHLILDKEDRIISLGKNRYQEFGAENSESLLGKKLPEIITKTNGIDIFLQDKEEIKKQMFNGYLDKVWLLVSNHFVSKHELHITLNQTIFDSKNQPVGCLLIPEQFKLSGQNLTFPQIVNLSVRQQEIIFLLAIGFAQKEIAGLYNISRGTIIKNIGIICDKFNLQGANVRTLIELAYDAGYGIPPFHLLKIGIFQLPTSYLSNYHLRKFLFE
jgi:DNA-binding CsgD family transcriptional regulator